MKRTRKTGPARGLSKSGGRHYTIFMAYEQLVATWISFMCTAIRKKCGLSRNQFIALMKKYPIIPFLADNYELLHYYDNSYVVDDVKRYVEEQGGTLEACEVGII